MSDEIQHSHTLCELQKWTTRQFEKLGWIILAAKRNKMYKVRTYKRYILQLYSALQRTKNEYIDPDRKHDIDVLIDKVKILKEFINEAL